MKPHLPTDCSWRLDHRIILQRRFGTGRFNQSETLRDLIRESLISEDIEQNRPVVATLSMIYDHHRHDLSNKLNEIQHHSHQNVLTATHVHLDHDNFLEVVIMKGRSGDVKHIADHMLSIRGVKHGKLVIPLLVKACELVLNNSSNHKRKTRRLMRVGAMHNIPDHFPQTPTD